MTRGSLRARTRPARHALATATLRLLFGALRMLPLDLASAIGAGLGRFIGVCARGERRRMRARLEHALPDGPPVGAHWADLGRRAVEFALADRALGRVDVPDAALATFAAARDRGRGVMIATAHLGNWELMAAALAARGFPVHAVAARPRSGPLHRWLARWRARLGVVVHPPGGGARAVVTRLRAGETAALFVDQATGERGALLPFFGRLAPTPTTFDRIVALTDATPLFVYSLRQPDGRHRVAVEALPDVAAITARLEELIGAHPTQWVWLHDRWRDGAARPRSARSDGARRIVR